MMAIAEDPQCTKPNVGSFSAKLMPERCQLLDFLQGLKATTLDEALIPAYRRLSLNHTIMKIDVEGAEARAVLGGIKFLELFDVAVIQMELLWFSRKMIDMETVKLFLNEMHRLEYKAYLP